MGTPIVAVDHDQLRTMESETVDPIDRSRLTPTPGSLISFYEPTFHVTLVNLCIIFQCN